MPIPIVCTRTCHNTSHSPISAYVSYPPISAYVSCLQLDDHSGGKTVEELLADVVKAEILDGDNQWRTGKVSGAVL